MARALASICDRPRIVQFVESECVYPENGDGKSESESDSDKELI